MKAQWMTDCCIVGLGFLLGVLCWPMLRTHKSKPELAVEAATAPSGIVAESDWHYVQPVPGTVTLSDRVTAVGTTTTWLGSPLVSTDKLQTITSKDAVQIGLRSDGVVVWRKAEGEGK